VSSPGEDLLEKLGGVERLELRLDEPMAKHTTLRIGGPADIWVRPADLDALATLLRRCHACEIPVHFVGGGTNLLVRDGGLRGVVINLGSAAAFTGAIGASIEATQPWGALTLLLVLTLGVAALASLLPARRAGRLEPVAALRFD